MKSKLSLAASLSIHLLLLSGAYLWVHDVVYHHDKSIQEKRICITLNQYRAAALDHTPQQDKQKHSNRKKPAVTPPIKHHLPKRKKPSTQSVLKKIVSKKQKQPKKTLPKQKQKQQLDKTICTKTVQTRSQTPNIIKPVSKSKGVKETLTTAPRLAKEKKETIQKKFITKIRSLFARSLYYPRKARKRGIEGEVILVFTLSKDGQVINETVKKSNAKILSRAALKTLHTIEEDLPKPPFTMVLEIPLEFRLHD